MEVPRLRPTSDLIRGLIQRILDHPDGLRGEVVIFENGQGRGSLACDTSSSYDGNTEVHANANDESQTFLYLVDSVFNDPRVSANSPRPDPGDIHRRRGTMSRDGYRNLRTFPTPASPRRRPAGRAPGRDLERERLQPQPQADQRSGPQAPRPGGSEITASLKHFYGVVSMSDGHSAIRHYSGLGETCGKMIASVRTPV